MKQRNPILVALFSIISCGVYALYWFSKTKRVLVDTTNQSIPPVWLLMIPAILSYGLFAILIVFGIRHHDFMNMTAATPPPRTFLYLFGLEYLASLIFAAVYIYWFIKYGKAVNSYTNGQLNTAVTFLLLYLLGVIGMAIIQDKFNEMPNEPTPVIA